MRYGPLRSTLALAVLALFGTAACSDVAGPVAGPGSEPENPAVSVSSAGEGIIGTVLLAGTGGAATDISENGLVTGDRRGGEFSSEAFLWEEGSVELLGVLNESVRSPLSRSRGVNDFGQVVGVSRGIPEGSAFPRAQAFLWEDGSMMALPDPPTTLTIRSTLATAVNSRGDVVGFVTDSRGSSSQAVLWPADGSPVVLPPLAPSTTPSANAMDINDRGQIVGRSLNSAGQLEATIWENGVPRGLGLVVGSSSQANGINENGDVVGISGVDIVLWPHDGPPSVLGEPGFVQLPDASIRLVARDINNRRQIVGYEFGTARVDFDFESEFRGFAWQSGTFVELKSPDQETAFRILSIPNAINDAGVAVGRGTTPEGDRALRWDVPEISGVIAVQIDIKPGSDPNAVACRRAETVIPVAILSTQEAAGDPLDFDATTVDHSTVAFEGAGELHLDADTGEPIRHEEDVDADGDTDLVLHFRLGDTDLTCSSTEGTLTGETVDGTAIEGTDAVRIVGG